MFDTPPCLLGTSQLPALVDCGRCGQDVQLGRVVRGALAESRLDIYTWNLLPEPDRDQRILGHLGRLRAGLAELAE